MKLIGTMLIYRNYKGKQLQKITMQKTTMGKSKIYKKHKQTTAEEINCKKYFRLKIPDYSIKFEEVFMVEIRRSCGKLKK